MRGFHNGNALFKSWRQHSLDTCVVIAHNVISFPYLEFNSSIRDHFSDRGGWTLFSPRTVASLSRRNMWLSAIYHWKREASQHWHLPLTFWSPISVPVEQDSETQWNRGSGKQLVWVKPAGGDFGNWKVCKGSLSSVQRILPS